MAVEVRVTSTLRTLVGAKSVPSEGTTVGELLANLDAAYPGFKAQISGGDGQLHRFVNVYLNDEEPDQHMIGKFGLSMYLPPTTTSITLPGGFLEPGTAYKWEVLAIEESGNQTLSSGAFETA